MEAAMTSTAKRRAARRAVLAALLASALAGCNQYVERGDTIYFGAGDAMAVNAAIMTRDPWPPHAYDVDIRHDGARMVRAVETYRSGPRTQQSSGGQGPVEASVPASPMSPAVPQ